MTSEKGEKYNTLQGWERVGGVEEADVDGALFESPDVTRH